MTVCVCRRGRSQRDLVARLLRLDLGDELFGAVHRGAVDGVITSPPVLERRPSTVCVPVAPCRPALIGGRVLGDLTTSTPAVIPVAFARAGDTLTSDDCRRRGSTSRSRSACGRRSRPCWTGWRSRCRCCRSSHRPPPCDPDSIWLFTPMTWPWEFRSGPPLLPLLMAASVWMTPVIWIVAGRDDRAVERAHDAGRGGVAQAVGVADGDDGVTHLHGGGVGEVQRRQLAGRRADADHGDVLAGIAADDAAGKGVAVVQAHPHRVGVLDDVVVGDDVALRVDLEAGALCALGARRRRTRRRRWSGRSPAPRPRR